MLSPLIFVQTLLLPLYNYDFLCSYYGRINLALSAGYVTVTEHEHQMSYDARLQERINLSSLSSGHSSPSLRTDAFSPPP